MMKTLSRGAAGPQVQLLQLALARAGFDPGGTDGVFGGGTAASLRQFQRAIGLAADGVAGPLTHAALLPYYTGSALHVLRRGDSLYRIAQAYGASLRAVSAANPGLDPLNLQPGEVVTVPLPFEVVPTEIDWCSELVGFCCAGIAARYPAVTAGELGRSVLGRPLWLLSLGDGENRVFYNAAHHANEWITTPLLLKFVEELARAWTFGKTLNGTPARALMEGTALSLAPCVNPDGLDLVTGDLNSGGAFEGARRIAAAYPGIPFPSGWKANILGTDLNLQYPANWEKAREIKFAQGFDRPAPRDYVGAAPLTAPESAAVWRFARDLSPALTLSYHTQGRVIYWKYLDYDPPGAREIAARFSAASGYLAETTPYASGFAGFKDWYIQEFNRPGYTIEAGLGDNPLPLSQFDRMYRENLGILTLGLTATRQSD